MQKAETTHVAMTRAALFALGRVFGFGGGGAGSRAIRTIRYAMESLKLRA